MPRPKPPPAPAVDPIHYRLLVTAAELLALALDVCAIGTAVQRARPRHAAAVRRHGERCLDALRVAVAALEEAVRT